MTLPCPLFRKRALPCHPERRRRFAGGAKDLLLSKETGMLSAIGNTPLGRLSRVVPQGAAVVGVQP